MRFSLLLAAFLSLSAFGAKVPQCVTAGCSSQLCVDAQQGDMLSTCEWRASYACYQKHGTCEAQPDGTCGWTPGEDLKQCLANPQEGALAQ